jgi:hypothetical protein
MTHPSSWTVLAAALGLTGCNLVTGASSLELAGAPPTASASGDGGASPSRVAGPPSDAGSSSTGGGDVAGGGAAAGEPGGGGTAATGTGESGASDPGGGASGASDPGCQPACGDRQCGPDGCGGECGPCSAEQACTSAGQCVGSPTGTALLRFDTATLNCGSSYDSCTIDGVEYADCCPSVTDGDTNKCFCRPELAHLNVGPSHFIGVASDAHKGDIWAAGNVQAVYVNELNSSWGTGSGEDRADEAMSTADASFHGQVPKWFLVNEISVSLWPDDADYRLYVRRFAARLHGHYGKEVVIASPFPNPGYHAADWTALQSNAYVAPEVQLTGAEVNASGNSVAWCVAQYQDTIDHYANVGVPLSRLVLVDNFANPAAGTGWGRAGVSADGWRNAIATRAAAAAQAGFAGYWSYAWGNNAMADDELTRLSFEDAYTANPLP